MSFKDITIRRRIPIIGQYVDVPDGGNKIPRLTPDEVTAGVAGTSEFSFGITEKMRYIEIDEFVANDPPAIDYYKQLRDLAKAKL